MKIVPLLFSNDIQLLRQLTSEFSFFRMPKICELQPHQTPQQAFTLPPSCSRAFPARALPAFVFSRQVRDYVTFQRKIGMDRRLLEHAMYPEWRLLEFDRQEREKALR